MESFHGKLIGIFINLRATFLVHLTLIVQSNRNQLNALQRRLFEWLLFDKNIDHNNNIRSRSSVDEYFENRYQGLPKI